MPTLAGMASAAARQKALPAVATLVLCVFIAVRLITLLRQPLIPALALGVR